MVRSRKSLWVMAACVAGVTAFAGAAHAGLLFYPVVTVVGDGATTLSNAGFQTTVAVYAPTVPNQAAPISFASYNTGAGTKLVNSGSASSEGSLTNNPGVSDAAALGQLYTGNAYTYSAGYDSATGIASVINAANNAPRALGQVTLTQGIASNAIVLKTNTQATSYNANNIRGATGDDTGTNIYSAGTATTASLGGWRNFNANTILTATPTNVRTVELLGGNLFGSTGAGSARGIYLLDANGVVAATPYITTGTATSPYEFALFNDTTNANSIEGYNVAYIADDGSIANGGGIEKWIYNGATWTQDYILRDTGTTVYRGLAGQIDPDTGLVTLYATTADDTGNKLQQVTDTGVNSPFITLATASPNTLFRGVALAPVPEPASLGILAVGCLALLRRRRHA